MLEDLLLLLGRDLHWPQVVRVGTALGHPVMTVLSSVDQVAVGEDAARAAEAPCELLRYLAGVVGFVAVCW